MPEDINGSIKMNNKESIQNTDAWLKSRIGKFCGSSIGDLMGKGRKKDELFSQTALTLIYKIASERDLRQAYLDDDYLWGIYQEQVSFSNKFTRFGHENEDLAIETYEDVTGNKCTETGSINHPTIPNYAASPDRLTIINGVSTICEVKCPKPETFIKYKQLIKDNSSLLSVEPNYFYQMQAEMHVSGCSQADFIAFCPFLKHPLHIVRITADEEVQKEIEYRISEAEKIIYNILNK